MGFPGATVSLLASGGGIVATATSDITGFYHFATTGGVLTNGANYTIEVNGLPAGDTTSNPASQALTWQGAGIALSSFVLN